MKSCLSNNNLSDKMDPQVITITVQSYENHYLGFEYKFLRLKFIRNVFGLLTMEFLVMFVISSVFLFEPNINQLLRESEFSILKVTIAVMLTLFAFGILFAFLMRNQLSLIAPYNFILFAIFTLLLGIPLAFFGAYCQTRCVFYTEGVLFEVCLFISLYASLEKWDFNLAAKMFSIIIPSGIYIIIAYLSLQIDEWRNICLPYVGVGIVLCLYLLVVVNLGMSEGIMKLEPEEYFLSIVCVHLFVPAAFLSFIIIVWLIILDMLNFKQSSSQYFPPIVRFWEKDFWLYKAIGLKF